MIDMPFTQNLLHPLFFWMSHSYVLGKAEENITNLLLSHKGIHHYVQNVLIPSYSKYQDEGKIPSTFYAPELLSSSYIVRNQHVSYNQERKKAGLPELYYKMAANNPRNPVNKADAMEKKLIGMFNEDRDLKSFHETMEIDGKKVLYVAIPFLANEARCMRCHDKREDAPIELQQRYPGQGGFNEKIGEIRAITSIYAPIEDEYTYIYIIGLTLFVGFSAFGCLFFFNNQLRSLVKKKTVSLEEDIAKRKLTESALKESENNYRDFVEGTNDLITRVDGKGCFTFVNKMSEKYLGISPEKCIGTQAFNFVHPDDRQMTIEWFQQCVKQKQQIGTIENRQINSKTNEIFYMLWITNFDYDAQGDIISNKGIGRDITDSRIAEQEKEKLETQLRQTHKMDAIGTLAGGIAHDFNNILSIIIGYAEFIREDSTDNPQIQENIEHVKSAADRAKHLVKQILAFSRQSEHELIPVRLQSLVKETIKLLRSTIPTTIEIIQNIDPQCGVVNADPAQINQIVMNLCTNAVHAMDEKGVLEVVLQEIDLKPESLIDRPTTSPGKYVCLSVSDTGSGMDKKTIDHIFDPFFTTKGVGKGTGMGLSVVHGIVESHDGFITVESQMGEGSTFNVFLPVTEKKEFFEVEETAPIQTGNERILIVDDEESLLMLGKRILDKLGYEVTAENSSVKALEIFKSDPHQFDLIITDQAMPNMSGTELVAEIVKVRPDVPLILCTGFSSKVSEENAKEKGISKFINKPYTQKILAEAVREVLVGKNYV